MKPRPPLDAIRQLRRALSMSQRELAKLLKVSQPRICDWECGRRFPTSAQRERLNNLLLGGGLEQHHAQRLARQLEQMQAGMALFAQPDEAKP